MTSHSFRPGPARRVLSLLLAAVFLAVASGARAEQPEGETDLERGGDHARERAAWNAMMRRDSAGRILSENRIRALAAACDLPVDRSLSPHRPAGKLDATEAVAAPAWQSIGPMPIQSKVVSSGRFGNVSGRISGVAVHPSDPTILLAATATGGLWKSTDSGATWRAVSDNAGALATSAVVFAPSNPLVVYAATGEVDTSGSETIPNQSLGTYLGAGLLRSADGGETWTRVDVDLPANAILSRVVVNPADPQSVLVGIYLYQDVAANSFHSGGVYRSTDGGVHFTQTFVNRISDMVGDPGTAGRVYVGAARCPDCAQPSGVYVSTDFGQTWSPSLVPGTPPANFTSPSGRIRLGATRAAGATVLYASVLDGDNSHAKAGIFRSADGGATWAKVTASSTMCPAPATANQCFYDHWITPDAGSSSTVYFGSIRLYKSSDGGATWTTIVDNYNTRGVQVPVHPDQHGGVPGGAAGTFYFANDGGLYRTRDGGLSFDNLNATLTLAQFNGIALHPTNASIAMGGTQDNGSLQYTGSLSWSDRTSGDGGINLIRHDNPNQMLAAFYQGHLAFSNDGGGGFGDATPCDILMDCSTDTPLEDMSFYVPMTAAPAAPGTAFLGTNRIWANPTFGADAKQWKARSSGSILSTAGDSLTAIEVLGDGSGTIWAGSTLGEVLVSTDGGATFVSRKTGLPAAYVSRILAADPSGATVYVVLAGFLGSPSRHVFRTNDGGSTWTNVSSNLPDAPMLSLAINPQDGNDLFVGSDVGVFHSANGGASWSSFSQGLPNVSVTDLRFSPVSGELFASTYGRGVFKIAAPQVAPIADFAPSVTPLLAGQSVLFVDVSTNKPTAWTWNFGDPASGSANTSTLRNPRHTFASPGTYTVTETVTNSVGTSQKTLTVSVVAAGSCVRCTRVVPSR
jgi:PKD repeat protein